MNGFCRIAAGVPRCQVADFTANTHAILELWQNADRNACDLIVFPELSLTAYTTRDLLHDQFLHQAVLDSLAELLEKTKMLKTLALVGLPLRVGAALYNVALVLSGGKILAAIPKSYLPNYREFEEVRWFRSGKEAPTKTTIEILGQEIPFGTDILLQAENNRDFCIGVEICEDLWVQSPPHTYAVSAGATVIANLSASNFTIGKAEIRRMLAQSASDRGKAAYLYVAAGPGESSTDLAFDADAFIYENGTLLAESIRFSRENQLIVTDIDLEFLVNERMVTTTFGDCAISHPKEFRRVRFDLTDREEKSLKRKISPHPFLPSNPQTLAERCWETFEIQTNALVTRMQVTGIDTLVLGVSGGLDSTHAALVAAQALDMMELPRENLLCVTMPGLGTTDLTKDNAVQLVSALDGELLDIGISDAARVILQEVDHPVTDDVESVDELLANLTNDPSLGDITLENVQARLRTLLLMTLANQRGGLVIGTGDLSEKALGWSTYAGDHISMYDLNAGIPKTLIQFVIRWVANERVKDWSVGDCELLRTTLFSILDTPISPELLPANASGGIAQLTEDAIGPYELHDFYLYYFVRHHATPRKILRLALHAFGEQYSISTHKRWLTTFYRRFFNNQFKRSCTADAPKVGMVALSPRADWRMPSDAVVRAWIKEVEAFRG